MVRTQVQLPTRLYERTRAFASGREISIAEVFRNAVELYIMVYGDVKTEACESKWRMPVLDVKMKSDPFKKDDWRGALYESDSMERIST